MKRWALVTVALYGLLLMLFTLPVCILASFKWSLSGKGESPHFELGLAEVAEAYQEWGYWLVVGLLMVCQAALLLIPLKVTLKKLVPRRHVLVPICTAALLLGCLCITGVFSIACSFYGDEGYLPLKWVAEAIENGPVWRQLAKAFSLNRILATLTLGFVVILLWMIWGYVFYRFAHADDPAALSSRIVRWLLRGSILELLVAVPSHIVIRGRHDCCAPAVSFCGIVTGLSVMLISFGPGVYFLFVQRARRLRAGSASLRE